MKIAGLLPVKNYNSICRSYQSLRQLTDIVIVLDNNSTSLFPYAGDCDEYMIRNTKGLWHDVGNRTHLMYSAYLQGCDWCIHFDDDFLLGNIRTREDIVNLIKQSQGNNIAVAVRDLWNGVDRYRSDHPWNSKAYTLIQKNIFSGILDFSQPIRRLHGLPPGNNFTEATYYWDKYIYHTGNLTPTRRQQRVDKYKQEDPQNQEQSDYDYILCETGLETQAVPVNDLCYWPPNLIF